MSRPVRVVAALFASFLIGLCPSGAWAGLMTQTESLPLTPTDFGPGNKFVSTTDPLVFQKFNDQGGALVLDSVKLDVHAMIQNTFGMTFTTPATITDSVATGNAASPGPAITLFQPDASHALLAVQAPNDPTFLTRSVTYGKSGQTLPQSFGSQFDPKSPFYLAPAVSQQSGSLTLTKPADLAIFAGTGTIKLPVAASAVSRFSSSSGNGGGSVTTAGSADVTVTYSYHARIPAPEIVPEPTACVVWSLGGASVLLYRRARRRGR